MGRARLVAVFTIVQLARVSGVAQLHERTGSEPLRIEDLRYPREALVERVEGFVVVQVDVGDDGTVRAARALSGGHKSLSAAAMENATHWQFARKAAHSTVLVYRFDIDRGRCSDDTASLFRLRGNAITVTACTVVGRAPASVAPYEMPAVVRRPRIVYPEIAVSARVEGAVVLELSVGADGSVSAAEAAGLFNDLHARAPRT